MQASLDRTCGAMVQSIFGLEENRRKYREYVAIFECIEVFSAFRMMATKGPPQ